MSNDALSNIRSQIDTIDQQIYQLLKQRAECAQQVATYKRADGENGVYYRPEREAQILRRIVENNDSALEDKALKQIFRDILTACLALQQPQTIAYLGPKGTFSQQAVEQHFGQGVGMIASPSIRHVFREVDSGKAHYGVVPIENSTEGMVTQTLDALLDTQLTLCGEIELNVHLNLLRQPDQKTPIQRIYSHPQALAQCRQWLEENMPNVEVLAVNSTTQAAQQAADEKDAAAIAAINAQQYGLQILDKNIEDNANNTTRFLILGQQAPEPSGKDKTSLVISTPHDPGALSTLLEPFNEHNINLTMIASRPYQQRNWSYIFFMDIEGHQQDSEVAAALNALQAKSVMLQILGSYPRGAS